MLQLQKQELPDAWRYLKGTWANQDTDGVSAQILLEVDHARYFPDDVRSQSRDLL